MRKSCDDAFFRAHIAKRHWVNVDKRSNSARVDDIPVLPALRHELNVGREGY